jgi:hypothetical protein
MADQNERFYVRFKGRVLGPLTREKTVDLAKRGQITKQHELSPDGVAWRLAQEFPELFERERAVANQAVVQKKQQESVAPEAPTEEWCAHFDGSNQGPVDVKGMKNWIALGMVKKDTMIWRPGMAEWQSAELIRAEWFGISKSSKPDSQKSQSDSSDSGSGSHRELSVSLLRMRAPVVFLAITGVVIGTAWVIFSIASFFMVATRGGSGPMKVMAVVLCIVHVSTAISWFTGSMFLLQFGNKLAVLVYRSETNDLDRALQALVRFWKFTAIVVLVWLIIVSILGSIIYLLGLSVPF